MAECSQRRWTTGCDTLYSRNAIVTSEFRLRRRNWTIPWSVYAAGFVYGLMYWAAVTETEIGRKKRDVHSAGDDGFYGQVGEARNELATPRTGLFTEFLGSDFGSGG